jgi:hypothetical protein
MRCCGLLRPAALVLAILAWQGTAAAGGDPRTATASRSDVKSPPSYRGAWYGITGQGEAVSFTVNRRNRITRLELSFEIEGDACTRELENELRGAVATIRNKRFKVSRQTAQASFTLTGRFTSSTAVSGRLSGTSEDGCSGSVSTTWRAKKGAKPPPAEAYDGTWLGSVVVPAELDPALVTVFEPTIELEIVDGAVTSMTLPWAIDGTGCQAVSVGRYVEELQPPVKLAGTTLSAQVIGQPAFTVDGVFSSVSAATGTLTMSGTSSLVPFTVSLGGVCTGSLTTTWSASKQAVGRPTAGAPHTMWRR